MHEPKGQMLPLSGPRRFIIDMVHFARRIPTIPVGRVMDVGMLAEPREAHPARPSWAVVFMKAYSLVCAENPPLRRALVTFPRMRLYEHPQTVCALTVERRHQGEEGIFVGLFRAPEHQSLDELQDALNYYKHADVDKVGYFRQLLRICAAPMPLRRLLWWTTLNVSGWKRAKRFGTFGLTTYGSLGSEQYHPISPLSTTLTFGPIDEDGRVCVKLIYDHRVLDGAYVARRLRDVEEALHGPILQELKAAATSDVRMETFPPAA